MPPLNFNVGPNANAAAKANFVGNRNAGQLGDQLRQFLQQTQNPGQFNPWAAYQAGLQQGGNAPIGGAFSTGNGGWGYQPQVGQNYLGSARQSAATEYASDAAARGLLASTPQQLALTLAGQIPGAAAQTNVAQINNQGRLTGLREVLAAIAPMLAGGLGGGGGGPFPINTNYGAGINWGQQ